MGRILDRTIQAVSNLLTDCPNLLNFLSEVLLRSWTSLERKRERMAERLEFSGL